MATVRGWTSPPYFFTLAASPPIRSWDMPSAVEMRVSLPKHLIVGGFFTFDEIGTINSTAIQTAPFDICLPLMVYYVITRDCMKQIN